jgi:hypothetical protein
MDYNLTRYKTNRFYKTLNISYLQLPLLPVILFRPHPRFPWRDDPIRINRILDLFVESAKNAIVERVRVHDLIHDSQMCAIFTPTLFCTILNQRLDQPVCLFLLLFILAVKHNAHDVVHLAHTNRKRANKVQPSFFTTRFGNGKLSRCVIAVDLRDGREEEMRAVGKPAHPA